MYAKNFHASIKDFGICPNNPALEDSVIQNHFLGISAHVCKKSFHVSIKDLRICPNNLALEDLLSKITIRNFCACTQTNPRPFYEFAYMRKKSNSCQLKIKPLIHDVVFGSDITTCNTIDKPL